MQRGIAWIVVWLVMIGGLAGLSLAPARGSELWVVEPGAPHCGQAWPYQHLIGNLHNHTFARLSDHFRARGYEKEIAHARAIGVQVFGLSDHDLDLPADLLLAQQSFAREQNRAEPAFVALAGWEWTIGSLVPGKDAIVTHVNGFGCPQLIRTDTSLAQPGDLIANNMATFYDKAVQLGQSATAVFQFNHPWAGTDHFKNFAKPANFTAIESAFALCEIDSGLTDTWNEGIRYWWQALQAGWRVAPTVNNDTEGGISRAARDLSTGIWVEPTVFHADPERAVLEALRARRCYARRAKATLQFGLSTGENFAVMGERLRLAADGQVDAEFSVSATSRFATPKVSLSLVRPGTVDRQVLRFQKFIGQHQTVTGHVRIQIPRDVICVYLGFSDKTKVMVSAPVWLDWSEETLEKPSRPAADSPTLQLIIEPGQKLRLGVSSYADWHQMLVIRRNGGIVHTTILTQSGQRQEYQVTNHGKDAAIITLEPFHRPSQSHNWQPTRLSMTQNDSQPPLLLFEDGDDQDFNDLIVEIYRE